MAKFWNKTLTFEREHFSLEDTSEEVLTEEVLNFMARKYTVKEFNNQFSFDYSNLWVTLHVKLNIQKLKKNNFKITFVYSLLPMLLASISFIIIALFLGRFSNFGYILIGFLASILYIFIHSLIIEHIFHSFFRTFPLYYHLSPSILLEQEQEFWTTQPNTCSACGTEASEYEKNCKKCGTLVNQYPKTPPYNISKYTAQNFMYSYKSRKK